MNKKQIIGTVTIVILIGGCIYAVKKSRDQKKAEENSISVKEAMEEVAAMRKAKSNQEAEELAEELADRYGHWERRESDEVIESRYAAKFANAPIYIAGEFYDPERDEDSTELEEVDEYTEGPKINDGVAFVEDELDTRLSDTMTEEDITLRHDPNSREARSQYIKMELAEWAPLEDTYQIMLNLFEFPFNPLNDGDWDLKTRIIDHRVQFFGYGSIWNKEVSYADVILHYARNASFNVNDSVRYWVEFILDFSEFDITTPSHRIDELLEQLNSHTYYNEERTTFGLFGLTRERMDQAIKIANRNVDRSVTYEIEFNEFLKSCI